MSLLDELHCDVAIIGAGFSGTMVAVHLLNQNEPAMTVALIERRGRFARGVAYSTGNPAHLLNVPAGKMSAFPDAPAHFFQWLQRRQDSGEVTADAATFVPRMRYGAYLDELLETARHQRQRLFRLRSEAIDVEPLLDGSLRVRLANGCRVHASKVILALGNFPPGDPPLRNKRFHQSPRYLSSPWSEESQEKCAEDGDILILGTGLTTLDLLLTLRAKKHRGTIHVLSRRGLFPQPHRADVAPIEPFLQPDLLPKKVRSLIRMTRREIDRVTASGGDWRAVIDSLRPFTQALWQGFDLAERRRFFRHARSYWESHRHRAPGATLGVKDAMESTGALCSHRGRLMDVQDAENGDLLVSFRPHRAAALRTLQVRYLVNCTGPECNYHRLGEPLVLQLFARGLIRPDPMLLGLDVTEDGAVRNQRSVFGQVFTLGSPRKGMLLETTAVPELRVQAQELAHRLRDDFAELALDGSADPDPAYAYEI